MWTTRLWTASSKARVLRWVGKEDINSHQSTTVTDIDLSKRTCLIMDEVDGMSAGDRGGVGAMNTLIKRTKVRARSALLTIDPTHSHL